MRDLSCDGAGLGGNTDRVRFLVGVAGIVLLVSLTHLVIGWVISNRLYQRAFVVGPRPKELGVRVRNVDRHRIVLEAPTPRQDIGHPGTLGLTWEGGYGRVGEVIDVEGTQFVRSYERVTGTPPVCTGDLDTCPPVEMDPFTYPTDPTDAGLAFEPVVYTSPLGPMGAWLVPAQDGPNSATRGTSSHIRRNSAQVRWAVHCHGWTAERRELVRMLPAYHEAGMTSLVIDYRNDPQAPADPTGRYRFGLSEWEDLEAAVQFALDRGAGEIVLSGCSTGGALVMRFLESSPLASRVIGVVMDAPNLILADAFRWGSRESKATPLMREFGMWIADLRWKIDWEATNYVQRAETILHVPTLVFHGTSDQVIPIAVSRQLQARVPDLVDLVETPAAGHVMSWNADPGRYDRYLTGFLERL